MKTNNCTDPFGGQDKQMHFCICLLVSALSPILGILLAVGKRYGIIIRRETTFVGRTSYGTVLVY